MKKRYLFLITAIIFSTVFLPIFAVRAADPLATLNTNPTITYSAGTGQIAITGTFNAAAGSVMTGSPTVSSLATTEYHLSILYGLVTPGQPQPAPGTLTDELCYSNNTASGGNNCSIVFNSDGSGTITASISNLTAGTYIAVPYYGGNTGIPIGNSQDIQFTINSSASNPSAQFVSATASGTSGEEIKVNVFNIPQGVTGFLQLGTGTEQGSTSVYTCTPGTLQSPTTTLLPTTGTTPTLIDYTFQTLPTSIYCIRPVVVVLGTQFPAGTGSSVDSNGYWTAQGALFAIGTTLVQGATNNQTANSTGCSTSATGNTGYCLLAPLPGVGDTTGLLNVSTGIGSYINSIIKLVMGLIGVLAVLMIIVGAIEYMSTVNIGEKEGAKNRIVNALLGLVIALGSYLILNTINPNLTNLTVTVNTANVAAGYSNTPYPAGVMPTAGSGITTTNGTTPTVKSSNPGIDQYNSMMQTASAATGIECTYGKAIMSVEDPPGTPSVTSPSGAVGLMQLLPATFQKYGSGGTITDAQSNINAGFAYLAALQNKSACNGNTSNSTDGCTTSNQIYVSAAYNGGAGVNGVSADCGPTTTQWQCSINRGGLQQTYNYAYQVQTNYNAMKAAGSGC